MAHAVTFTATAAKALDSLDRSLIRRIKTKVLALADAPRPPGSVKLAGHVDLHRIRVGDYRIVYRVDDAAETVEVAIVAHRREAYRGL